MGISFFCCKDINWRENSLHINFTTSSKAVLKSLNTALSANISVAFQGTLNLYAYNRNNCLAVLCKFLGDFWTFWERNIFSQRIA